MDSAHWIDRCQQLEARIIEQDREIKDKTQQLEDADEHAKLVETERKALRQEIKNVKTEMEIQAKNTTTLARIGVAVRVRFLEHAKGQVMGLHKQNFDVKFIQRGNDAAHRAYGAVDSALFTGNYLTDREKRQLEEVYGLIYDGLPPQSYGNMPPRMLQAIDHQGSIVSLYALNNGSMSIRDKQAAGDSMDFLKNKRIELGDDAFEKDEEVARHLRRLGEFADLIIAKSRRQGALTHGANPGTPSSSYGPPQTLSFRSKRSSPPDTHRGKRSRRGKSPLL
ncbi:uncharacterized protein Bfra_005445 [Botrytis fragariae]|uniref:Uncharacterized protein n=1 Tax=Botrytis fragariae TaxID=1964551 RepID=A0A8H6EIZ8_9HELO|nr:uncharacterized protein Bfra_005445 [Botrytis fragariae]KAF5873978.1 hypothetical protein Bfra_005445 [Botrytis fragariae]